MASASSFLSREFSPSSDRSRRASDTSSPPNFDFHLWNVAELIPWQRQTSAVAMPASCSFEIAMICSSLNLLRFILVRLLGVGLYQKPVTFQGSTSLVVKWK
jgi:hypothetical protein